MSKSSIDNVLEQLFPDSQSRQIASPTEADLQRLEGQFGGLTPTPQVASRRSAPAPAPQAPAAAQPARGHAPAGRAAPPPQGGQTRISRAPRARAGASAAPAAGGNDLDDLESMLAAAVHQRQTGPQPAQQQAQVRAAAQQQATARQAAQRQAPVRQQRQAPAQPQRQAVDPEQAKLLAMYRTRIGDLRREVRLMQDPKTVRWDKYDQRAKYLVRLATQGGTFEELIGRSGMPEIHATYMVAILVTERILG